MGRVGCFCRFFHLKFKIARIGLSIDTKLSIHIYLNVRLKALVFLILLPLRGLPMGIMGGGIGKERGTVCSQMGGHDIYSKNMSCELDKYVIDQEHT